MPPSKNLFLFYGENTYLSQEKINIWKTQFAKKYGGDFNTSELNGKTLTASKFKTETESLPFAAEKRLVIINDFLSKGKKEEQKLIAEKLDKIPEHSILIFHEIKSPDKRLSIFKKLKKAANLEEFKKLEGLALTQWVNKKSIQLKAQFEGRSANLLTALVGQDLWQIENEIKKLALYKNGKPITEADIKKLVSQNFSESIFTLTDAIAAKNPKKSITTLHTLIDSGEDILRIFHMIIRHFRILIQIKDLLSRSLNQKEITDTLKLHPFVIKNGIKQTHNFSQKALTLIYRQLLAIEIKIKSGKIKLLTNNKKDLILAIEELIIKLCK